MRHAKLKDIYEIRTGYQFRSKIEPDKKNGNVDVIQIKNVDDFHRVDTSELTRVSMSKPSRYLVQPHDILFLSRGRMFASVVPKLENETIVAGYFFVLRATENNNPHYVSWYLNGPKFQHYTKSLNVGRQHMAVISRSNFQELAIPLPPLEIQHEIVRLNQLMVEEATLLDQLKAKRAELVRGICNQLASGEIKK